MNSFLHDIRFSVRMFLRNPGFTGVVVVTLALGIGINTIIFSAVNALVIRPLPFDHPEQLVMVFENNLREGIREFSASGPNFLDWRKQNDVFQEMAALTQTRFNLTAVGEPTLVSAFLASPSLFQVLRVQPIRGRTFLPDEEQPGKNRVIVLSHGLWQRQFGAGEGLVGQTVRLDGQPYTVIGILPPNLGFLDGIGEAFIPLALDEIQQYRGKHYLQTVARLKEGLPVQQAEAEMKTIARRLEESYPDNNQGWSVELMALQDQLQALLGPALFMLQGTVGFVLLICCCNVASLLLARAAGRTKEVAIRTALGAGRLRVIRQFMAESLLLALAGGVLGTFLAVWGTALISGLPVLQSSTFRLWNPIQIDSRVLVFALGLSLLTALLCGLVPALRTSKPDLNAELKDASRMSLGRTSRHWWLKTLIVSETALALVLLIGTGLMVKTVIRLGKVDPGFIPDNVLSFTLNLPEGRYPDDTRQIAFFEELQDRVRSAPGVLKAALTDVVPLGGDNSLFGFTIEGRPTQPGDKGENAQYRRVSADYFQTLRIPVLSGRSFTAADRKGSSLVVMLNETMARRYWPTGSALGRLVRIAGGEPCEIVGVVKDERFRALDADLEPIVYVPYQQGAWWLGKLHPFNLMVHTQSNPQSVVNAIRKELRTLDKDLPLSNMKTMEQLVARSTLLSRLSTQLLAAFALIALGLSMLGIYGILSYAVGQATRDIGVRMALGARPKDVVCLIIKQGLGLVLVGLVIGLGGAWALTRALSSLLYGVSATDPGAFALAALLFCGAALLACLLPARRAARIDPMVALRYE